MKTINLSDEVLLGYYRRWYFSKFNGYPQLKISYDIVIAMYNNNDLNSDALFKFNIYANGFREGFKLCADKNTEGSVD